MGELKLEIVDNEAIISEPKASSLEQRNKKEHNGDMLGTAAEPKCFRVKVDLF